MMTPEQIKAALDAGIITPEQAADMLTKSGKPSVKPIPSKEPAALIGNEDDMRFLRSFSDVFIAMGIGLLCLGLGSVAGLFGGGPVFLLAAGVAWVLSEYFGKARRAHLPTVVLALSFLIFVQSGAQSFLPSTDAGPGTLSAVITFVAMIAYYIRFRLPFCVALLAISALYLVYAAAFALAPNVIKSNIGTSAILSGLILFAIAIAYDMRDTDRLTRFADNAFWLHLTAAPLIIHGIALQALGLKTTTLFGVIPIVTLNRGDAMLMLVAVFILALIGLALNRRALLVSSLGYAGLALGVLIKGAGLGFGASIATTLIVLGALIVFLGAGWHGARRGLLKVLPRGPVMRKVFPPEANKSAAK